MRAKIIFISSNVIDGSSGFTFEVATMHDIDYFSITHL